MTLEEAIKLNNELLRTGNYDVDPKFTKALKLGIEALKAWREAQREQRWPSTMRLPSETKE